jgi:hypothetical protein
MADDETRPKRPVTVDATRFEASAAFNVLSLLLQQPDTAPDVYAIFTTGELTALGRYANRLADGLHVARPRLRGGSYR